MSREYRDLLVKAPPDECAAELEEKARGLIPRGGSGGLRNRLWDKREKLKRGAESGLGKRIGRATAYLSQRYRDGGFGGRPSRGARRGRYTQTAL